MQYLTYDEVIEIHRQIIDTFGGLDGVRDIGGIESALAQPQMTFGTNQLYPTIASKASSICFSLVMNHPFVDGNKRVGHAAMETFLVRNGFELNAVVDDAEQTILLLASSKLTRVEFESWLSSHISPLR